MKIVKRQNAAVNQITIDGATFDLNRLSGFQQKVLAEWITHTWCIQNDLPILHGVDIEAINTRA